MEGFSLKLLHFEEDGQTAVEYLLLLLVLVSIITSLLLVIKKQYFGDPEKCLQPGARQTIACKIVGIMDPGQGGKPFQYFPFKK